MNTFLQTDDYLSLLLSLPQLAPITVLSIFFLTLARLLPILVIAPFLGARNLPTLVRMMFGVSLVAIFLPQNLLLAKGDIPYGLTFIFLMVKELLIGVGLAFVASAPFFIAQMGGSLIDHQKGASALQVTDPTTQSQTGDVGILFNYVFIVTFFFLGGPFLFFEAIATSYQLIPVDGLLADFFFQSKVSFWKVIFSALQEMFKLAVQLASPALVGILVTDMFLGIANRLAPQVQIVFLGISLKAWVGISLLTAGWALVMQVMGKEGLSWMKMFSRLIEEVGRKYSG